MENRSGLIVDTRLTKVSGHAERLAALEMIEPWGERSRAHQATATFFAIVKEMYRVVRHGGQVLIAVPHPLHNSFLTDPTHIRAFTPDTFLMLSRARNLDWVERRVNVTMLALMLDVDFEPVAINNIYDKHWAEKLKKGEVTELELRGHRAIAIRRDPRDPGAPYGRQGRSG